MAEFSCGGREAYSSERSAPPRCPQLGETTFARQKCEGSGQIIRGPARHVALAPREGHNNPAITAATSIARAVTALDLVE
jgi:hypothetical protein